MKLVRMTIVGAIAAAAMAIAAPAAFGMAAAGCTNWSSGNYRYSHCTDYDGSHTLTVTGAWGTSAQGYWHVYYW